MARGPTPDIEMVKTIARIRKLLADGYTLTKVAELTGWTKHRLWYIKEGRVHNKTSLPLNELDLRKPRTTNICCRRCGEPPRIFAKSGLCIECELFELAKLGLVVISEPEK